MQLDVHLDAVVDAALRLARPAVQALGSVALVRGTPAPGGWIEADALLLEQALLCVILNGAEAANSRVEVVVEGQEVVITDDGPGFTPPTEAGQTSKPKGMGVGLSLARLIVEEAGGRLEVGPGAVGARVRLVFSGGVDG